MSFWLPGSWRPSTRVVLAFHAALLVIQWVTVRSAPLVFQRANGAGWYAVCLGLKKP